MFTFTFKFSHSVPALFSAFNKASSQNKPTRPSKNEGSTTIRNGSAVIKRPSAVIRVGTRAPRVSVREIAARFAESESEALPHSSLTPFDECSSDSESESDENESVGDDEALEQWSSSSLENQWTTLRSRQRKPRATVMEVAAMFDAERADRDRQRTDRGVEIKNALLRIMASLDTDPPVST